MIRFPNETIEIALKLDDGDETMYPQVTVKDTSDDLQTTVDLSHAYSGIYKGAWDGGTTVAGEYKIDYLVYTDADHTTQSADYNEVAEDLFVVELNDKVDRLLGLSHENVYIDDTSYDGDNNLVGGRLRIYSDADSVGTGSDVIGTYTITADGDGLNKFASWQQVKG